MKRIFNKIVIWGHKPNAAKNRLGRKYTHTHSYIHQGFARAFEHLGFEVLWLDATDDVREVNFSNAVFLTEGQVDDGIPLIPNARYVLHHCDLDKYLDSGAEILNLCNYVRHCDSGVSFNYPGNSVEKINNWTYLDTSSRAVYQPWATDLLPYEIDKIGIADFDSNERFVNHIGSTKHDGLAPLYKELRGICRINGRTLHTFSKMSRIEVIKLVRTSYIAMDLRGDWHKECGYIPCRTFKNLSYGKITGTNSPWVHEMFNGQIPFGDNLGELFENTQVQSARIKSGDILKIQNYVRDEHTYLNRVRTILGLFELL